MKLKITAFLTLALALDVISAQISFFDQRFPPAPATRRQVVVQRNNGQSGRRSAALIQAPPEEQVAQMYEDPDQETQEPLVQEPVAPPTQRPLRNGGAPKPSVPSRRVPPPPTTPPTQQRQDFGQTLVGEGPDDQVSQRQDQGFTDISMDDVSTERGPTPTLQTFTSSEEDITDDGFTPTVPVQRPIAPTTRTNGPIKGTGNGRPKKPTPTGGRRNGNGLVPTGLQPVSGNGRKPSTNGNGRRTKVPERPITQVTDGGDGQVTDVQVEDGQVDDGQVTDGRITDGQISDGQVTDGQLTDGQVDDGQVTLGANGQRGGQRVGRPGPSGGRPSGGIPGVSTVSEGQDEDHGDHHDHHSGDPIQWLRDAVRGEPGADYPIFYEPPETGFKCGDQQFPGYYADVEARCQVFHICQENGRSDAFLCPNGTIFSQQNFVCVWWHDFDCSTSPQFYQLNAQLYTTSEGGAPQEPSAPGFGPEEPVIAPGEPGAQQPDQGFEVEPGQAPEPQTPGGRPGTRPGTRTPSVPTRGGPSTRPGGVPTRGRPGTPGGRPKPAVQAPIDSDGFGPEEPTDERLTGPDGQIDTQAPEQPGQYGQTEIPTLPGVTQVDIDDTPAPEVVTSRPKGFGAPNGRPPAGVKGGRGSGVRNGVRNGKGTSAPINGNGVKPSNGKVDVTTTRPVSPRNGAPKKTGPNGQRQNGYTPVSPADKARNGMNGKTRPNGTPTRTQRPVTGTKSVFRTAQRQELDGSSSSNRHWFYYLGL